MKEDSKKPFYITTTIPYVNAKPHIGHALEFIQADVVARNTRLEGRSVFFNTGADEHGQKIYEKAQSEGKDVQDYVDFYASELQKLEGALGLSNDVFIRTTSEDHKKAAQVMWEKAKANGDIYKKKYKGLYCVSDEMFLKEKDLVDGRCINHPEKEPVELEEENYFFALSKYQDHLLEYLNKPGVVVPEFRRQEAINFVKDGLEDVSISRIKEKMAWGVPVPDDDGHVMYVWFDALTNYISTLGWPDNAKDNFARFWKDGYTVQVAGKDQIRFQSILWQAMLMSAGIKTTDQIFYHGFINSGGKKMSKSVGNVIDPLVIVDKYGTDALRYYLLRHIHPTDDSDMTIEKFHEVYTAHLVNGVGNLTSRILKMAETHLDRTPDLPEKSIPGEWFDLVSEFKFHEALDQIWKKIGDLDQKITDEAPFKLIKTDPEAAKVILRDLVIDLYTIGRMLNPIMPQTSKAIKDAVKSLKKPENPLFPRIDA